MKKIERQEILFDLLPHNDKGKLDWKSFDGVKVEFIYNDIHDFFTINRYDSNERKIYTDYHGYKTTTYQSSFLKSQISKVIGKKIYGYKYDIGQTIGALTILDRYTDETGRKHRHYKYHCNVCGNEDWCFEKVIAESGGCNVCFGQKVLPGYNDICTTDSWMIPFFQGGEQEAVKYSHGSSEKLNFICPDCGRIRKKKIEIYTLHKTKSIGCGCSDGKSYPNKFMYNLLTQLGIDFRDEWTPEWIKPKKYDFYIENENIIIEMDGGLGHGRKGFKNGDATKSRLVDDYKNKMATLHGIKVVRIDSLESNMEYLREKIISSRVFTASQVNRIDFTECDKFATTNNAKLVCELYEEHKPITPKELSEYVNFHNGTIVKYLKKGSKFGWCSYNAQDAKNAGYRKAANAMKEKYSKPVYVFDIYGNYYGRYNSEKELDKKSIEDFGIHFGFKDISRVCNETRKQYKGYVFSFNKTIVLEKSYIRRMTPVEKFSKDGKFIKKYQNPQDASEDTGISASNISGCCKGKRRSAGGFIWKYVEDID